MFRKFKYNLCVNTVHSVCNAKSVSAEIEFLAIAIISNAVLKKNTFKRMLSNKFCVVEAVWASMFVAIKMLKTRFNKFIYTEKLERYSHELITAISFSLKELFKLSPSEIDSLFKQFEIFNSDTKLYEPTPLENYIDSLIDSVTPFLLFSSKHKKIGFFEFGQDLIVKNIDPMLKTEYTLFFLSLAESLSTKLPNDFSVETKMENGETINILSDPSTSTSSAKEITENAKAVSICSTPFLFKPLKTRRIKLSHVIFAIALILGFVLIILGITKISNADSDPEYTPRITFSHETTEKRYVEYPEPQSGYILLGSEYENKSELTIHASASESCVVKLKTRQGDTRLSFYVRAGDSVTVGVPCERLYVYFASGKTWYGRYNLFGEYTSYSKDSKICNFEDYTWEYTLYPVSSGNFSQTPIGEDEF